MREAARTTTLIAGVVAIVAFPAWALFDSLLVPEQASRFLGVRIGFEVAIALTWLLLLWRRVGGRWPEQMALFIVALPQVAICWMLPLTGDQLEPYLLGLSLAIYASAFLIMWRWQLTVLLVVFTGGAAAAFWAASSHGPEPDEIASMGFYLVTSGTLAIAAQVYRCRTGWERFVAHAALEDEQERNAALVAELDQLTREDPLTVVGNRRAWEERIVGEVLRARRGAGPMSVIICDLDHFKAVNDTLGHAAGDRVLRAAAALLTSRVRATDFVARLGGDEFGIICPVTSLGEARLLANEIADLARTTAFPDGVHMTLSVGVAEVGLGDTDPTDVLHRADRALYCAKVTRDAVQCA